MGDTNFANQRIAVGRGLSVIRCNSKSLTEFIRLVIQENVSEMIASSGTGMFASITGRNLKKFEVNLPPLPVQKRIVDLISAIDSCIEALQQQLESAKKSRNAALNEFLLDGLTKWQFQKLSDICDVRDGTHDSPKETNSGFPLVTSKNLKKGRLDFSGAYLISQSDFEEVNKRSKVERLNLLFSMIGTIGEVIVIEKEPNFAIKNVGLIRSTEEITSKYLYYYFISEIGIEKITSSVSGSTQKFISLGKLRTLPVLMPPREIQEKLVSILNSFDRFMEVNETLLTRAWNLRSGLLSDLLSGEHEIPVSYDKVLDAA